ncbi:MAG TPA: hypothetical protein VEK57_20440 [Thermoanaerobaculia bacterium]|nr:hypothetical protein [Thermoanaerobaculia bacterium]
MSEVKRSLAAAYAGHARSRAEKTSKAVVIWTVALFYVWLFGLETYYKHYLERQDIRHEKAALDSAIAAKRSELLTNHRLVADATSGPAAKAEYDEMVARELTKPRKQLQSLAAPAAEVIAFKIPPGVEFPVPAALAPLIWSALLLMLLTYVAQQRLAVLRFCARALRVYRRELNQEAPDCVDVLCNMPMWLAPLPSGDSHVSTGDLEAALGWRAQRGSAMFLVPLAFGVLVFIQSRVTYLGYVVAADLRPIDYILRTLSIAALLAMLLLIAWWFAPRRVPDEWTNEPSAAVWTRRQAAVRIVGLVTAAIALPSAKILDSSRRRQARSPRYRRALRTFASSLPPGFYKRNDNATLSSKTIHYVTGSKKVRDVVTLAENLMQVVNIRTVTLVHHTLRPYPRVHLSTAAAALEEEALLAVRSKRYSVAISLLQSAVEHDLLLKASGHSLNHRAHDLLAGLSIRYESNHSSLKRLIALLQAADHRTDERRIQKWQNPQSKWRRVWSDRSAPVKWSGLLM